VCRSDHLELDDRRDYGAVMARDEGLLGTKYGGI
jgi:hypothetical protein